MNPSLVCIMTLLSAPPAPGDWTPVYSPSEEFAAVVRGQTPGYDEIPSPGQPSQPAPGYSAPPTYSPNGPALNPYQPAPRTQDPFLAPPGTVSPYGGGIAGFAFGANGPQPFKFGWTVRQDIGFLPKEPTDAPLGNFGITEFDTELEYTTALPVNWIFSFTQQFNTRLWDGPHSETPAAFGLPGHVHRFGWDFELATPANRPWSFQLGFNPSLNSDFDRHPTSDAWNWDGRGIAFYRVSPHWMLALGAGFWDRVEDRVIPYAGVVWTPNDRWEWRLLFPESRISYFLGQPWGVSTWLYTRGQYHIEAYEIEVERINRQDKIEIEDWRILIGLRSDNGWVSTFVEAGWVFGRDVDFLGATPGFDISSGFIARGGLRF